MRPKIDPKVDYVFKRLFGSEGTTALLIDVLNAVPSLPAGKPVRQVTLLNPFSEREFDEDKQAVFDVRACDQGNRQFALEMQRLVPWSFPKRALLYWARAFVSQLREGDDYVTLQPAYLICFLERNCFQDEHFHHTFRMEDVARGTLLCKDAEIHTLELAKFRLAVEEVTTPCERWCYFLKHAHELDTDRLPAALDVAVIRQAMEVLVRIDENERDRARYLSRQMAEHDRATLALPIEKVTEFLREQITEELTDKCLKEGMDKGLKEGMKEGMDKGLKEGLVGQVHLLQRLLKQPQTPHDDLVALSVEELKSQVAQLEQKLGAGNGTT